jgi:putative two-component system response regulator
MDGYEVCRRLQATEATRRIPVIFLTALGDPEDEAIGLGLGAVDYVTKPIHPELVRARVRNHLELSRYRQGLEEAVRLRTQELERTQAVMIEGLATLAESRDPETGGHIKRTQNYVKALAVKLKHHPAFRDSLDDATIELLYLSTPLHDIGKVGVRDAVLLKPGKLDAEEYELMKQHASIGYEALRVTERKLGSTTFLRHAIEIAVSHHERWDGGGYPNGLAGRDIPASGRLMAVADVYDALVSRRVYKSSMPHEEAVAIIAQGSGSQFDPDVVDAFLELGPVFRNIARTFADYEEERQQLDASGDGPAHGASETLRRVLLADDNAINREITFSQLASAGFLVQVAENGSAAFDLYRAGRFDLVLTDIEMPLMDGYALTAAIRRLEAESGHLAPIFAITASALDLDPEKAREHGLSGYMLKPLDLEVLETKLADFKVFFAGGDS